MPEPAAVGPTRIGIDLGGTKIEAVALSPDGIILARHRVPTPRDDYQGTLVAIAGRMREKERAAMGRLFRITAHLAKRCRSRVRPPSFQALTSRITPPRRPEESTTPKRSV